MLHLRYKELVKGCACNVSRRRVDERVEKLLLALEEEIPLLTDKDKPQPGIRHINRCMESLESAIMRETIDANTR